MTKEKPLSEKNDFYSIKRKATIDIRTMKEEKEGINTIYYKIQTRYGLSEGFVNNTLHTIKKMLEEIKDRKEEHKKNEIQ